jgi:hypothetical protein
MKLTPKQVALVYPFLPGIFARVLRFTGRRNSIQLQEMALVVEGELVRLHYLGFERLFARALAEWTTVTIPYSRLVRVRYSRRWVLRTLVLAAAFLTLLVVAWPVFDGGLGANEAAILLTSGVGLILFLLVWVTFRAFLPGYVLVFRAKDGKTTRFLFRLKSKQVKAEFENRLNEYRTAALSYVAVAAEGNR